MIRASISRFSLDDRINLQTLIDEYQSSTFVHRKGFARTGSLTE